MECAMAFPEDDILIQAEPQENEAYDDVVVACDVLPIRDQRAVIFHLLYAIDAFDYDMAFDAIVDDFVAQFKCIIVHSSVVYQKTQAIVEERHALDEAIKPLLHNWRFERLSVSTKLVLRIALWELMHTDLAVSVVINEALELSKCFAEEDAHKFINGVLDEWVKVNRPKPVEHIVNDPV